MARVEEFNRREIISKAMNVFWEKGYNGTSIQDLVNVTGLNRSSIYNSFGSKQSLYKESLALYEEESDRIFRQALLKSSNPLEAIRRMMESVIDSVKSDPEGKGCFIMNCKTELGNSELPLRKWLLNNQEKSVALFRELIEEGQETGLINKKKSADIYAYTVYSTFQGLRITGLLGQNTEILQEIIESTINNLK